MRYLKIICLHPDGITRAGIDHPPHPVYHDTARLGPERLALLKRPAGLDDGMLRIDDVHILPADAEVAGPEAYGPLPAHLRVRPKNPEGVSRGGLRFPGGDFTLIETAALSETQLAAIRGDKQMLVVIDVPEGDNAKGAGRYVVIAAISHDGVHRAGLYHRHETTAYDVDDLTPEQLARIEASHGKELLVEWCDELPLGFEASKPGDHQGPPLVERGEVEGMTNNAPTAPHSGAQGW